MTGSRPVRQWMFWRGGFWKRPVLMMLYFVTLLPVGLALAVHVPQPLLAAHAIDAGTTCASGERHGCVLEVKGTLDGPHYTRGPGDKWWVRPAAGGDLDAFDTDPGASDRLGSHDGEVVTALEYDGSVAAVRLGDGTQVRTRESGLRGTLFYVAMALMCFSFGLMAFAYGWGSRRKAGSWFAVTDLGYGDSRLAGICFGTACCVFAPLLFGGLPLFFGGPIWLILGATGAGCALLVFGVAQKGLPRPRLRGPSAAADRR